MKHQNVFQIAETVAVIWSLCKLGKRWHQELHHSSETLPTIVNGKFGKFHKEKINPRNITVGVFIPDSKEFTSF